MKISFHTGLLDDLGVDEAVRTILDAGYDEVELNAETLPWSRRHVSPSTSAEQRRRLAATGAVCSVCAHYEGLSSRDPQLRRMAVDWTVGCAQLAADVGTDLIHVIAGAEPGPGPAQAAARPLFVDALGEIVDRARPLGVRVALEPIIDRVVATTDDALAVLDAVPGLGLSLDASHLVVTTHDLADAVARLGARVTNVAVKDGSGTPEDFVFGVLGTGDVDFAALLAGLAEQGFTGPVTVEHESHQFGDTRPAAQVLTESLAYVRSVLPTPVPR